MKQPACPMCGRQYNILHADCGDFIDHCVCGEEGDSFFQCGDCMIEFDLTSGEVYDLTRPEPDNPMKPITVKPSGKQILGYISCDHKHREVELDDGTKIYCSSIYPKNSDYKQPDFGLYADPGWRPVWRNEFISWPDRALPNSYEICLEQIREAFEIAQADKFVEIGCIGGHGRTGTILACMHQLSNHGATTARESIKFVRDNYCDQAIENAQQEWFVNYAKWTWFGDVDLPPMPAEEDVICSVPEHIAMALRGHKKCIHNDCTPGLFKQDIKEGANMDQTMQSSIQDKLINYPLLVGGIKVPEDPKFWPCEPIDHYAMITKGHDHCLRLGDDCDLWEDDVEEYADSGTIGKVSFEGLKDKDALEYIDTYPDPVKENKG